jgi:hypothetical protein
VEGSSGSSSTRTSSLTYINPIRMILLVSEFYPCRCLPLLSANGIPPPTTSVPRLLLHTHHTSRPSCCPRVSKLSLPLTRFASSLPRCVCWWGRK